MCSTCGGQGAVLRRFSPQPGYVMQQQVKCPACGGRGFELADGWHLSKKRESLDVFIEKGSKDGEKFKFREKGNMQPGCTTGDVCIVLKQEKHPFFKRKGADLLIKKEISLVDALCGFNFEIKHLDGRSIIVESNGGEIITDQCVKVLEGEGFPVKGDAGASGNLYLEFTVEFPSNNSLTPVQQADLYTVLTGRVRKRSLKVNESSAKSALRRLGSADRAVEDLHRQKLVAFKNKLANWRNGKLNRYDKEPSTREDRDRKYHDRTGYVQFLDSTIESRLDQERDKMQKKISFDADLSTSPRSKTIHARATASATASAEAGADDDEEEESFYLEEVSRELFGKKTDELRRGAADESDSDDERRGGGGPQQCHVQ